MSELRQSRSGRRLFVGGVVSMAASVAIVAGLLARKVSLVRAEGRARAADVAAGADRTGGRGPTPPGGQTPTPAGGAPADPPRPPDTQGGGDPRPSPGGTGGAG